MPISPPVQITVPFATSGLKNTIPANTNNVTGNAGYDAGFGSINMTPKTAGGIPPFGQDFNGIFFDISTALQFLEAGGSFPYSSSFATAVGGYPIGAIVSRTDSTGLWRNTVANNVTNPETFGAGWQPEDAGSSPVTMTNANVTLTALQATRSMIIITGLLTTNLQLIFPTYIKQWVIVNNTTGAFTITAKTAAGSGVVLPQGSAQTVYGDGTSIFMTGAGRLIATQVFTASGTYTPTQGATRFRVRCLGGGGGGGGTQATAAGQAASGGGGASGSYAEGIFSVTTSQTVTIGSAGTSAANAPGTAGGATSVGALISSPGGGGGFGGPGTAVFPSFGGTGGAPGAAPTGGNILSYPGTEGGYGLNINATATTSGGGASSPFGGGAPHVANSAGNNATGRGGGGGGSSANASSPAVAGGSGGLGLVIIEEFA